MKSTRLFGTFILLLIMVSSLLSACGGSSEEPAPEAAPTSEASEESTDSGDETGEAESAEEEETEETGSDEEEETSTASTTGEDVSAGKEIYEQNCVKCHGLDGMATGPSIGSLNLTGVGNMALTNLQEQSDDQLFATISGGKGREMPPWQLMLSEDQRWEVIKYIRTFAE